MAFKIGKERGAVWTAGYPEDESIRFQIRPLTPILNEQITGSHLSSTIVQEDGHNKLQTNVRSFGITREQAKAIVVGWEGVVGDDTMGPMSGQPVPCTAKYISQLFDEWDDGGLLAAFVVGQANKYAEIREAELKNSETPSATS